MWEDFLDARRHPARERLREERRQQVVQDIKWICITLALLAFIFGIPFVLGGWD